MHDISRMHETVSDKRVRGGGGVCAKGMGEGNSRHCTPPPHLLTPPPPSFSTEQEETVYQKKCRKYTLFLKKKSNEDSNDGLTDKS